MRVYTRHPNELFTVLTSNIVRREYPISKIIDQFRKNVTSLSARVRSTITTEFYVSRERLEQLPSKTRTFHNRKTIILLVGFLEFLLRITKTPIFPDIVNYRIGYFHVRIVYGRTSYYIFLDAALFRRIAGRFSVLSNFISNAIVHNV